MSYLDILRSLPTRQTTDEDLDKLHELVSEKDIFDESVLITLNKDPMYIERIILHHIVDSFHLKLYFEYLYGISEQCNAFVIKSSDGNRASGLFFDEVLDISIMHFLLIVWAYVYQPQYIKVCKDKLSRLVNDVLIKRKEAFKGWANTIEELNIPDRAIVQALDMYWAAWTFVVGHEIFHIINNEILSRREEELRADRFGFQVLITFIEDQKSGILPKELDSFYEDYYLVPCILMEIFRVLDLHREDVPKYGDADHYPSPEERMHALIDLYDTDVPDDFDTEYGNAFFATFLDAVKELCCME